MKDVDSTLEFSCRDAGHGLVLMDMVKGSEIFARRRWGGKLGLREVLGAVVQQVPLLHRGAHTRRSSSDSGHVRQSTPGTYKTVKHI